MAGSTLAAVRDADRAAGRRTRAIAWIGDEDGAAARPASSVVDLAGALVTPAFVDAHVHVTGDRARADRPRPATAPHRWPRRWTPSSGPPAPARGRPILGGGWDETALARAAPADGAPSSTGPPTAASVYLARVDAHSAVVSSALLAAVPGLRGAARLSAPDGLADAATAHDAARTAALRRAERGADAATPQRAALQHAAALGHRLRARDGRPGDLQRGRPAALLDAGRGRAGAGGDRLLGRAVRHRDGPRARGASARRATCSATARSARTPPRCTQPYADRPDDQRACCASTPADLAEHIVRCADAGPAGRLPRHRRRRGRPGARRLRAGAPRGSGRPAVPGTGSSTPSIVRDPARLAAAGLVASMQPVFDATWGGADGHVRPAGSAPTGRRGSTGSPSWPRPGVPLAFGSDAPVTALGPWAAVRAAAHPHEPRRRSTAAAAFAAHTPGGWRRRGRAGEGGSPSARRPPSRSGTAGTRRRADGLPATRAGRRRCRAAWRTVRDGTRSTTATASATAESGPSGPVPAILARMLPRWPRPGRGRRPPPCRARWAALVAAAGRRGRRARLPARRALAAGLRQRRRPVVGGRRPAQPHRRVARACSTGWRSSARCCTGPASTSAPVPWLILAAAEAGFMAAPRGGAAARAAAARPRRSGSACAWVLQEALRDRLPFGGFPWGRLAFSQADSPLRWFAALGGAPLVTFVGRAAAVAALAVAARPLARRRSGAPGARGVAGRAWPCSSPCRRSLGLPAAVADDRPSGARPLQVALIQGSVPDRGLAFEDRARQVLDNHVAQTLKLAAEIKAGTVAAARIWWSGRRTPPTSTRSPTRRPPPRSTRAVRGRRRADPGRRDPARARRRPPPQRRHPLVADHRARAPSTSSATRCRSASTSRCAASPSWSAPRRSWSPRTWWPARATACSRGGAGPDRRRHLLRGRLRRPGPLLGAAGAQLLVVQTNNATFGHTAETYQQLAMSQLRAVETGRTVLQVATTGMSAVIGPDGDIVRASRGALFTPAIIDADGRRCAPPDPGRRGWARARSTCWPRWPARSALCASVTSCVADAEPGDRPRRRPACETIEMVSA